MKQLFITFNPRANIQDELDSSSFILAVKEEKTK